MGPRPSVHGPDDPGGLDLYIGGMEHAVLHLLYSRFWHKVLFDLGFVTSKEPYRRLFNQGMIQAYAYTDARGVYMPADDVSERDGKFYLGDDEVFQEYGKMGKSLKNPLRPMTSAATTVPTRCASTRCRWARWTSRGRGRPRTSSVLSDSCSAWRLVVDEESGAVRVTDAQPTEDDLRALHKAIAGVRDDYANLRTNTAGAKLIELTNHLTKAYPAGAPRAVVEPLVVMLALAPHIADELWERLGHGESLAHGPFPVADEQWLAQDSIEIPIQVKGKVRSRITVAVDADEETVRAAALADEDRRAARR